MVGDVAGMPGEEVGASAADPELLPARGTGVRDVPKEPRLGGGERMRVRRQQSRAGWEVDMEEHACNLST